MRIGSILIAIILVLSFVSAGPDLLVEEISKGNVIISELNNPAVFDFVIINNNESEFVEIYTLVGVSMSPKGTFEIPSGTSTIEVQAWPDEEFRMNEGLYSFEYQIKGSREIYKDKLNIRVIKLKDVFEIESGEINPGESKVTIVVKNLVNSNLKDVNFNFKSDFFDLNKKLNLGPFEEIIVDIDVDTRKFPRLMAGVYDLKVNVGVQNKTVEYLSEIKYIEKEKTDLLSKSSGIVIRKTILTRINQGNTDINGIASMKRDILSRLFTSFDEDPIKSERNGLVVEYFWEKRLRPGESFSIEARTNYTFPVILVFLIIIIGLLVKVYTMTAVGVRKNVSYVKTKGGEFALRVRVIIRARKEIENVTVLDRLPGMTKLYEKFGHKPDEIDHQRRLLKWNLTNVRKGEERVFTYIIYSKLQTMGRFELPSAKVSFQVNGEKKEVTSNRAYFVSESVEDE
jgi:hypothetical protein